MTYREHAQKNGHDDQWIDDVVSGLFDPDIDLGAMHMDPEGWEYYDLGDWKIYPGNAGADVAVNSLCGEYCLE